MPNLDQHAADLAAAHTTMHAHQTHAINAGLRAHNDEEHRRAVELEAQRIADAAFKAGEAGSST